MIKNTFGDDGFMVKKDTLNNAVGYRGFTIGEAFTGPSQMNDGVKQTVEDVSTLILGKNAYRVLKKAEQGLQSAVSVAKSTIVIRSIVIPVANFSSNVIQLLSYGLTPRQIYQGYKAKLVEVETYIKAKQRLMEIEALQTAASRDSAKVNSYEAEAKSLDDMISGLSINPLIEAGMFSSISEGMAEIDSSILKSEWADKLQESIEKLPSKLGTVGRYAAMTQDSEIFKLLARATMYGDFLGKSILYDHQVKTNKKTSEQALRHASEAFVNYNFMAGRMYSYANASGLLWFWAYKIRSIKEAHRMIRDNPLKALTTAIALPEMMDDAGIPTGSPVGDNAITAILQDRAKYSIGPGMLFRAPPCPASLQVAVQSAVFGRIE